MVPRNSQGLYSIFNFACLYFFVVVIVVLFVFFCLFVYPIHMFTHPSTLLPPKTSSPPTIRQSMQYVSMKVFRQLWVYSLGVTFCRIETLPVLTRGGMSLLIHNELFFYTFI